MGLRKSLADGMLNTKCVLTYAMLLTSSIILRESARSAGNKSVPKQIHQHIIYQVAPVAPGGAVIDFQVMILAGIGL